MRRAHLLGLCLAVSSSLWAQDAPLAAVDGAAFEQIEDSRARANAALDAQEAACYRRFAVSGCLKEVQTSRRAMLATFRLREAELHEREFAQRGVQQRARVQQKAQEQQQRQAELRDAGAGTGAEASHAEKLQAQTDKQTEHAAKARQSVASSPVAAALPAGPTAAEQAANRENYARKQADAELKRQQIAKRLAGKVAAPLPLPAH